MKKISRSSVLLASFLFLGTLSLQGCADDGAMENAGEEIDEGVEEVGDEIDDATDR